mgnify:CR=1 FL=1
MENIHTPHIMYVDKVPLLQEQPELVDEGKGTLTLLNSVNYENKGSLEEISSCKYDRSVSLSKSKTYDSEKGKF